MPDTDIRPSSTSSKRSESAARNAFPMLSAAREAPAQPENVGSFERKLLDCLYDGVYFVDADRTITYWNQAAERLTGYAAEEAVGRHCFDNFLMHVDERGSPLCLTGCPLSLTVSDGELREAHVFLSVCASHRSGTSVVRSEARLKYSATVPR